MDLITVIVPIYNAAPYLNRCMDSIVHQTYPMLEIILIDDGSTDESPEIADQWAAKDQRITAVHKDHQGVSSARNTGLDRAHGDYIGFVDSDDYIEPDMYETLYQLIKQENVQLAMVGGDSMRNWFKTDRILTRKEAFTAAVKGIITGYLWNKLFRRDIIRGLRFIDGMNYEDTPFVMEALAASENAAVSSRKLYHYVYRTGTITNTKTCANFSDLVKSMELVQKTVFRCYPAEKQFGSLCLVPYIWCLYAYRFKLKRKGLNTASVTEKIRKSKNLIRQDYSGNMRLYASVSYKWLAKFLIITIFPCFTELHWKMKRID